MSIDPRRDSDFPENPESRESKISRETCESRSSLFPGFEQSSFPGIGDLKFAGIKSPQEKVRQNLNTGIRDFPGI